MLGVMRGLARGRGGAAPAWIAFGSVTRWSSRVLEKKWGTRCSTLCADATRFVIITIITITIIVVVVVIIIMKVGKNYCAVDRMRDREDAAVSLPGGGSVRGRTCTALNAPRCHGQLLRSASLAPRERYGRCAAACREPLRRACLLTSTPKSGSTTTCVSD